MTINDEEIKKQLKAYAPVVPMADRSVTFLDMGTLLEVPPSFAYHIYEMIQKGEIKVIMPMPPRTD